MDDSELKTILGKLVDIVTSTRTDVVGLKSDMAELKSDVAGLKTDVAGLKTDVAELKAGQEELRTDIAVLQSSHEELRRVTSSNHFRLMGRIELLSDQFTKHLLDHHDPMDDGRKRA